MNRQLKKIVIISSWSALVIVCGCFDFKKKTEQISKPVERVKISVTVTQPQYRTLFQERKFLATLQAYRETDLGPLTPGRVKSLPVQIGDFVKTGQVVAKMDDAQLVATEAQFASIKSQFERSWSLYTSNAIPKAQFEGIEAQYSSLKRQLESMRENTTIVAPFSGIVTARACEEGELFTPSMNALYSQSKGLIRITQLDPLKIDLDVDNQTIPFIKKGMHVQLTVDQSTAVSNIVGKIEWVNPQASATSQTFSVRVIVPNQKQSLRPGYFVEVRVIINQKNNVLSIPKEAVINDRIFVVTGGKAFAKKIQTGWITNEYAEIISGIHDEDSVVIKGNKAIPDSAEVVLID